MKVEFEKEKWLYHSPVFECDALNPEMMIYSPWSGHRLFAYDYVVWGKPKCIAELGSFYGCSSFAFLQAVKDESLNTAFYAVDTWAGDSFTQHDYQEDIYGQYKKIKEECFGRQSISMLRMSFDQAMDLFEDHSIDLLHIDGSHTYEDVKHDFYSWKGKVKQDGVVFFHDIGQDKLEGKPLGSHIFWEELKRSFPYTVEFPFSFGLGILFFQKEKWQALKNAVDVSYYQKAENLAAVQFKDTIRKQFFQIKSKESYLADLQEQIKVCRQHLSRYEEDVREKDAYIRQLESKKKELTSDNRRAEQEIENLLKAEKRIEADYEKTLSGKENYIAELLETVGKYEKTIKGKEGYIAELLETIGKYEETIKGKEGYIAELLETIQKYGKTVKEKEAYIEELTKKIGEMEGAFRMEQERQADLKAEISSLKEKSTQRKEENLKLKHEIQKFEENLRQSKEKISQLEEAAKIAKEDAKKAIDEAKECLLESKARKREAAVLRKNLYDASENAKQEEKMILQLQDEKETLENSLQQQKEKVKTLELEMARLPFGKRSLQKMR